MLLMFSALLVGGAGIATADNLGSAYRAEGRCGAYARAPLSTPKWACVGIIAGPAQGLIMPRSIAQIGIGQFIITDMGSWAPGRGRVLRLDLAPDGGARVTVLYDSLDVVHGLAVGPNKQVYIGERGRIWRFDPRLPNAPKEPVVDNLPATGLHRLKNIAFDRDGHLIINIGAPTDRCEGVDRAVRWPCPEEAGHRPLGALWRLRLGMRVEPDRWLESMALGLRNSMGLAVHAESGLILQAENSADYAHDEFPPDELNIIEMGRHYGWPYCVGEKTVVPEYRKFPVDCSHYTKPAALLPAHSAPLGMLFYSGELFPELSGRLIIAYHGYRSKGHRIVVASTDSAGRPLADARSGHVIAEDLVWGWTPQRGIRPLGSPVGLAVAADGSLWFVEDKNRTVMVILRSSEIEAAKMPVQVAPTSNVAPPVEGWTDLFRSVMQDACRQCHAEFGRADASSAWQQSVERGWVDVENLPQSKLFLAMQGKGELRPMPPPPSILKIEARRRLEEFLATLEERSAHR